MAGWTQPVQEEIQVPHPGVELLTDLGVDVLAPLLLSPSPRLLGALVVLLMQLVHDIVLDISEWYWVMICNVSLESTAIVVDKKISIDVVHRHHLLENVDLVWATFILKVLLCAQAPSRFRVAHELPSSSSLLHGHVILVLVLASTGTLVGFVFVDPGTASDFNSPLFYPHLHRSVNTKVTVKGDCPHHVSGLEEIAVILGE